MSEKEYIVTLKSGVDYDAFNAEMIANTGAGDIPTRSVTVANARPLSQRNTHYSLTDAEATTLRSDVRVVDVQIPPELRDDIEIGNNARVTDTFRKTSAITAADLNWGNARCVVNEDLWDSGTTSITADFPHTLTGHGVDVVIQDSGIQPDHIEFTNEAGVSRVKQIDWYAESGVSGTQNANHYRDYNGHGSHCAGTVAGRTLGWARNADIYSVKVSGLEGTGDSGGISVGDCFDVIKGWHNNKPVDPKTGFKRPTVVNASWGYSGTRSTDPTAITYRGNNLTPGTNGVVNSDADWNTYFGIIPQYYSLGTARRLNVRVASVDADVEECIAAGIHFCIAAGNSYWYIDTATGDNWNDTITVGSGAETPYRGSSPYTTDAFMVGNIDTSYQGSLEQKAESSCHGPGVDIFAPGTSIMSCASTDKSGACDLTDGTEASASTVQSPITGSSATDEYMKISGTSMASPQVAGMVASVLQANPGMTPAQMKTYIHNNATQDLLFTDTASGSSPVTHAFVIDAANGTSDYTFNSATDRSGAVSGNDPAITIYEDDTITLTNNTGAHPLYIKWQSSTGTGDVVSTPAATGQGPTNGTVSWTPTVPGVYYYQCSAHLGMNNTITVLPKQQWGDDDSITRSPNRILYSPLWKSSESIVMKGSITRT